MPIPQRVVDYFAIVGCSSEEHKNSGSGSDRLGVFSKQFPPTVLTRFPKIDHADAEFPRDLPMFCFPKGLSLVNSPEELVSTHCFALTEEDGSRVYGAALTFHIPYQVPVNFRSSSRRLLNLELKNSSDISASEDISWMLPKSIVLISHWPFYENMLKFLLIIYSIATSNTSVNVPIERAIANLIMETPLPPRGRISVRLFCYNQEIIFKRPPPNEMPLLNLNFSQVFKYLSVDNILIVFAGMLTERKILFVSDHIHRLAESLEVLTYLLFPFYWRHIYIPVLPKKLVDFVCAPMPFIMGIHRSYIPDELMLSGVFLIDLDNNSILSDQEGGLLHRIPDKSGSKLLRGLKKLTGVDSSLQMHKDSSIDVNRCMECFRNYHVSIMKTYRDFMEAPSEFVVDKFRKNQFLQAHPEKCEFLSDFLSTQLFQCFVDDRYGHSANNLEVLFFDECIDKDSGKGTAFLTDTSNIHKEAHDVIDPNPSGGETIQQFTYSTCFPPTLDEDKFLPIREVAQLFDPTKESEAMKNGMSGIAMKFFTDKNKYSRQFHSLKIRSSKQDSAFRKLLTYASLHQKFLDLGHLEFGKLSTKLLGQDIAETGTTVDQALLGMMNHIEERQHLDQTIVPMMNQKFSIPILMKASEIENDLKTLFSEAQQLDNEASRGKFLVDDAKNRYSRLRAQYINLENTARYFEPTVHELNRRIALEVDVSNHLFKKLQAETMFRGIVGHYEKRMPLIIEDIRRLNGERISVLKKCMEEYVSLYKEWVAGMNASINAFQELVSQVDVDKDIKTFSEGKLDFLQLRERGLREDNLDDEMETSFLESTQSSNGMLSSFKNSILERKPKYSLDLWGPEGLQVVASQALQSRRELKQIYNELENYADVMEWRSKAIEKITRSLPQSLEFGQSQNFLLCSLYDLTRNQCNWLKSVVIDIRGIAGSLRVVK